MNFPTPKSTDHKDCAAFLRDGMAYLGVEVTVSNERPLVIGPYTDAEGELTCPHGVAFYYEPTGEQIAQWAQDGVK
jgi:hypothetical protein